MMGESGIWPLFNVEPDEPEHSNKKQRSNEGAEFIAALCKF